MMGRLVTSVVSLESMHMSSGYLDNLAFVPYRCGTSQSHAERYVVIADNVERVNLFSVCLETSGKD